MVRLRRSRGIPSVLADIGAPEDMIEILAIFVQPGRRAPAATARCGRSRDDGQIHELAHLLKGSAATVGAQRLATVCDALCRAAANGAGRNRARRSTRS